MTAPTKPYARIVVPSSFGASNGDYLRLGPFITGEETAPAIGWANTVTADADVTNSEPDHSDSTSTSVWINAAETANDSGGKTGQGYTRQDDDSKWVKNTSGQVSLKSISSTLHPHTSDGSGFYLRTLQDVNVNAGGATMINLGGGMSVRTKVGDITLDASGYNAPLTTTNSSGVSATTTVPADDGGIVSLNGRQGVTITAGAEGKPANIAMTAWGYIKQSAYGPVSDWKYSTSSSTTYGWSKDYFYGEKYSEFHGESTAKFWGVETKTYVAQQRNYNCAGRINITFAGNMTLQISFDFTLTLGIATSILIGGQLSVVWPRRITILGMDVKICSINDMKVVMGSDLKVVLGTDDKVVGQNVKAATSSIVAAALKGRSDILEVAKKPVEVKQKDVDAQVVSSVTVTT